MGNHSHHGDMICQPPTRGKGFFLNGLKKLFKFISINKIYELAWSESEQVHAASGY
jgi:hypothetical protein